MTTKLMHIIGWTIVVVISSFPLILLWKTISNTPLEIWQAFGLTIATLIGGILLLILAAFLLLFLVIGINWLLSYKEESK
jgi:hypothetical protein